MFVASAIIGIVPVKRFGKRINLILDVYATFLTIMALSGASWSFYGKNGDRVDHGVS
jgi:hypothetical protein